MGLQKTLRKEDCKIYYEVLDAYWKVSEVNIDFTTNGVQYRLSAYASIEASQQEETLYHCSFDDESFPDMGRSCWLYTATRVASLTALRIDGAISRESIITALYEYIKENISYFSDAEDV